eukprot:PhM_4_TR10453/c2_g1_i1/m.65648
MTGSDGSDEPTVLVEQLPAPVRFNERTQQLMQRAPLFAVQGAAVAAPTPTEEPTAYRLHIMPVSMLLGYVQTAAQPHQSFPYDTQCPTPALIPCTSKTHAGSIGREDSCEGMGCICVTDGALELCSLGCPIIANETISSCQPTTDLLKDA